MENVAIILPTLQKTPTPSRTNLAVDRLLCDAIIAEVP